MTSYAAEVAAFYRESPEHHDAPQLCARCHQPMTDPDTDYAEEHADCGDQTLDEGFLDSSVERGIEELADGLADFLRSTRPQCQSAATTEQVARVEVALFLLRSTLRPDGDTIRESLGAHASEATTCAAAAPGKRVA